MPDYAFRRVTRADFPMLHGWLEQPHINGWWGEPNFELHLIEEEIDGTRCHMWIVETDGTPFAFIQNYNAHEYGAPHYAGYPAEAQAMDTFLGDPAFLGQGHAAGYVRARADILLERGAPIVLIDPDPENTRAIAAYGKAGFEKAEIVPCEDGDLVQVMVRRSPSRPTSPGAVHGRAKKLRQSTIGFAPN